MHEESDDDEVVPLDFNEELGDYSLPDNVRRALVLACLRRFITDPDLFDPDDFNEADNKLANAVMFHGPYDDFQIAMEKAVRMRAIVVTPHCVWTEESKPHYIVSLSN